MNSLLAIQNDIDDLYEESKYIQELWMRKIAEQEVKRYRRRDRKEKTNYQFSLEFHGSSFRFRWIYVRFIKNNGRVVRIAKPIATPRNHKYETKHFKHAESWELELIEEMEVVLYPIRIKKSALMKAHQTLLKMSKLLSVDIKHSTVKDRVYPTNKSISKYKESLK